MILFLSSDSDTRGEVGGVTKGLAVEAIVTIGTRSAALYDKGVLKGMERESLSEKA